MTTGQNDRYARIGRLMVQAEIHRQRGRPHLYNRQYGRWGKEAARQDHYLDQADRLTAQIVTEQGHWYTPAAAAPDEQDKPEPDQPGQPGLL